MVYGYFVQIPEYRARSGPQTNAKLKANIGLEIEHGLKHLSYICFNSALFSIFLYLVFLWSFWTTTSGTQGLLLAPCSAVTVGSAQGTTVPGIKPALKGLKSSTTSPVPYLFFIALSYFITRVQMVRKSEIRKSKL